MMTFVRNFAKEEEGQDLIEYSLLMAFIALASAALFTSTGASINKIWSNTSTQLQTAADAKM